MKKNLIISCIIFFIVNSVCAADLKFKLSGKDEYPFFESHVFDKSIVVHTIKR